jgi:integrase
MRWSEIDLNGKIWTIPAERAKNGVAHTVPLNAVASEVLSQLRTRITPGDIVFSTTGTTPVSGISKMKVRFDQRVRSALQGWAAHESAVATLVELVPWRLHDLRRTVATGLQKLQVRFEVTEAILNHVGDSRSGIAGVYQRHRWSEEKRDTLELWSAYLAGLQEGSAPHSTNVVTLARVPSVLPRPSA